MNVTRGLFERVIDYAGTYPPAGLDASAAVSEYAAARSSPDEWILGRLVWPAAQLGSLHELLHQRMVQGAWQVSAVLTDTDELRIVRETANNGFFDVEAIEAKVTSPAMIERMIGDVPSGVTVYAEVSTADPEPILSSLASNGLLAKIRTGGVTADAFPAPHAVLRFVKRCLELELPFKATAGLHHAVRGDYPLTYEPSCPSGTMFGFVNILTAVALLQRGEEARAAQALEDAEPASFTISADELRWRDRSFSADDVRRVRAAFHSFGSCSFREPVTELRSLGILS